MDDREIMRRIRQLRQFQGLTLAQAARALGVSEATLSRWETGGLPCDADRQEKIKKAISRLAREKDGGD